MPLSPAEPPLPRPGANAPPRGGARRSKARALLFLLVSLTSGVGAAWMIKRYLAEKSAVTARADMTQVAVAAMDVPLGTTLRKELIAYVDWPAQALPKGTFTQGEALEGRVVTRDVSAGEPFVSARLAASGSGLGMAAVVPPELRAMTVRVNEVIGVAGFVHPSDLVDVITTMRTELPHDGHALFRSKIVLQNIKVLAIGEQMVTQNERPVKVPVVTLLVTPEQSERLALATTEGKIQLTLRSRVDGAEVDTPGVTPPELFGGPAGEAHVALQQRSSSPRRVRREVAPAPPAKVPEVVEVLRGDRYEERTLRAKEGQLQ